MFREPVWFTQRWKHSPSFIKCKTSAVLLFCRWSFTARFLTRVRWLSVSVIVSKVLSRLWATVCLPEETGSCFLEKGSDWRPTAVSFTLLQSGLFDLTSVFNINLLEQQRVIFKTRSGTKALCRSAAVCRRCDDVTFLSGEPTRCDRDGRLENHFWGRCQTDCGGK